MEARRRHAQLVRVGRIFGVVDGNVLALDQRQGDIEGAGFGSRLAVGCNDNLVMRR